MMLTQTPSCSGSASCSGKLVFGSLSRVRMARRVGLSRAFSASLMSMRISAAGNGFSRSYDTLSLLAACTPRPCTHADSVRVDRVVDVTLFDAAVHAAGIQRVHRPTTGHARRQARVGIELTADDRTPVGQGQRGPGRASLGGRRYDD